MNVYRYPTREMWPDLIRRPSNDPRRLFDQVSHILQEVRDEGDRAVRRYAERFDGMAPDCLQVSEADFQKASELLSEDLKSAILTAKANIECFHRAQQPTMPQVETMPGVRCWQKSLPVEKVGLYIPGGTAPLFSTVLMLAVPAHIAGCSEIVLCSPADRQTGEIHPAVLYAASVCGVGKVYRIGGVQAIAAMAYGTETVPKVYKIFGPGNQYVTAAKQMVSLEDTAIDMPAGPSEVAVLADAKANPVFVAADLFSQAEHGVDSQVILLTDSEALAEKVVRETSRQCDLLPRCEIAEQALGNSRIILLHDADEMIDFCNAYAPEHLIVQLEDYGQVTERIRNAGSVFLGPYTPESAGDYASGTNHTLPTKAYARMYSGVGLDSFLKRTTFQEISREGLAKLGPVIETMAANEHLFAHQNAVTLRLAADK